MIDGTARVAKSVQLPWMPADQITRTFARFLRIEAVAGAVLLMSVLTAIALANSPWFDRVEAFWNISLSLDVGSWHIGRTLREWLNDGPMTLFFFVVALELKREFVLGELSEPRIAALSISAALGGIVLPIAIYLALMWGHPGVAGWGTVMSTDTAFVIGCLALLAKRLPQSLRVFMLSLAIVDDVAAILVVAFAYSHKISWEMLAVSLVGFGIVRLMAVVGVREFPAYFLAGALVWIAVDASGVHATITGVVLGLMTPARRWVSDVRLYAILDQVVAHPSGDNGSGNTKNRDTLRAAEVAAREALSPVERLEITLHPWIGFLVMPLFAFANAGLPLASITFDQPITLAVFVGFAVGKPLGILIFTWLAVRIGIAIRPQDLRWGLLTGGGFLAGIGFTMALFISNLAFPSSLLNHAKSGILLASVLSAVLGLVVLFTLTSTKRRTYRASTTRERRVS